MAENSATASLAHDIRNILTPALLAAEALSKKPEVNNHHTDRIFLAIDKTVNLCQEAMKGDQSTIHILQRQCRLSAIIDEALRLSVPHASSRLVVSAYLEGDDDVILDRNKLLRMVFNLTKNAANAIGDNTGSIRIDVEAKDGEIAIHVRDDGPGIPLEVLDRLFPSLVDGKTYTGRIGMGLPVTAQAAASMGGELILRSTSKKGTHFLLRIPYLSVAAVSS